MAKSDSLEVAARLHKAAIRLLRMVRAADDESGVSAPKLSALSVLAFAGPQRLSSLARAEQVTPATMSKLVSDLEAEGLVAKRANAEDKRSVSIEVTARGRALMERARAQRLALLQRRLAALSAAERAHLNAAVALIERLVDVS